MAPNQRTSRDKAILTALIALTAVGLFVIGAFFIAMVVVAGFWGHRPVDDRLVVSALLGGIVFLTPPILWTVGTGPLRVTKPTAARIWRWVGLGLGLLLAVALIVGYLWLQSTWPEVPPVSASPAAL